MVSERAVCPRSLGVPAPSLPQFVGGDAVDASALSFLVRQSLLDREKEKRKEEEELHGGAGGSSRGDVPGSALAGAGWQEEKEEEEEEETTSSLSMTSPGVCVLPQEYTGSFPSSTHCLDLQWIHVPASVPEAFWDELHTIST